MPERGADAGYGVDAACLPDDAPAVVRLWGEALGRVEKRQQKLQWFYAHPGRERARLFVLRHTGEIVGATGIGPRSLWWRGSSVDAALMGDFAVASRHRTLYPAMLLQRSTLQQGLQEYALLYGFPNARSLPVVRRVGYQVLPGMARYARMRRSAAGSAARAAARAGSDAPAPGAAHGVAA